MKGEPDSNLNKYIKETQYHLQQAHSNSKFTGSFSVRFFKISTILSTSTFIFLASTNWLITMFYYWIGTFDT